MNTEETLDLDALVQEKIEADEEFSQSIADLSEEEKEEAMTKKRNEVLVEEIISGRKNAKLAENYRKRAEKSEKAEKAAKSGKGEPKKPDSDGNGTESTEKDTDLSTSDLYALMGAQVPEEDVPEVQKAAKLLGVTIKEALKDPLVKTRLETLNEERKTAQAANTKSQRSGQKTPDGAQLVQDLKEGKVPKPDSKEAEELFWARRGGKKN